MAYVINSYIQVSSRAENSTVSIKNPSRVDRNRISKMLKYRQSLSRKERVQIWKSFVRLKRKHWWRIRCGGREKSRCLINISGVIVWWCFKRCIPSPHIQNSCCLSLRWQRHVTICVLNLLLLLKKQKD